MKNPFSKFEKFGSVCDYETRRKIAQNIFIKLLKGKTEEETAGDFMLPDQEDENIAASIEIILSNETLREMTRSNPRLAEEITVEILNFIHQSKRAITALGNPYEDEVRLLDSFSATGATDYKSYWKIIRDFLKTTYPKEIISPDFYTRAFNRVLNPNPNLKKTKKDDDEQSYESIRGHLTEKWSEQIVLKVVALQQEKIDEFMNNFNAHVMPYLEELQKMKEEMYKFATDFNQIFDMPKSGF